MEVEMSTKLVELRNELAAKQERLAKVFEEAGSELDMSKVKSLEGSTVAKVEQIRKMNQEIEDLAKEVEALADLERAKGGLERMLHPTGDREGKASDAPERKDRGYKDFGSRVVNSPEYIDHFVKSRSKGGLALTYDDMWPSEWLIKEWNASGFKTLFETTAGWAPESIRLPIVVEKPTRPIQVLDIIPMQRTSYERVVYMEETTRTHGALETAEGTDYASSTFVLEEKESPVRKITDSIAVTDEQLEDVEQAQSYLQNRLLFGLRQRLDQQVLIGNGTPPNLTGILATPGISTQAVGSLAKPDAIHAAARIVRVTGRAMPTHVLMHPEDWEEIRLLRTAEGVYVWGNPYEAGPERLWGLPVVQTDVLSAGTGLVGSFDASWVSLFERRGIDVQIGFVGDQFTKGQRTIRADTRFAFVVFRPAAFCKVTGL